MRAVHAGACAFLFALAGAAHACAPADVRQFRVIESSSPNGIVAADYILTLCATDPPALRTISTSAAPRTSGGSSFSGWIINGSRAADPLLRAANPAQVLVTQDITAVAVYLATSLDTDDNGALPDWWEQEFFGALFGQPLDDAEAVPDQFTLQSEFQRGLHPMLRETSSAGGVSRYRTDLTAVALDPSYVSYRERSEPSGIFGFETMLAQGTPVVTITAASDSNALRFAYWSVNGLRIADAVGLATNPARFGIAGPTEAVGTYVPATRDIDGDALPDWWELANFGNTTTSPSADADGDGFDNLREFRVGLVPRIKNSSLAGSVSRYRTGTATIPLGSQVSYLLTSTPSGTLGPDQSGFVEPGTVVSTSDAPDTANNLRFGYWDVNAVTQRDALGAARHQVSIAISADSTFTAHFYPPAQDTDSDTLPDWFELMFGNGADMLPTLDSDGDTFLDSAEFRSGLNPRVKNSSSNGSVSRYRTELVLIDFRGYPAVREVLVGGLPDFFFANGTPESNVAAGTPYDGGSFAVAGLTATAPAFGDWDGDGDLDVFVGGAGGAVRVYRNGGSPVVPDFETAPGLQSALAAFTAGIANPSFAVGDLTGDGRADLVIGGSTGTLRIVSSDGSFTAPSFALNQTLATGDVSALPALIDTNNDGRLDLVVVRPDGSTRVFAHTGNNAAPFSASTFTDSLLPGTVANAIAISAGDVNEDGRADLVVSDNAGSVSEFYRQSNGSFQLVSRILGGTFTGYGTRVSAALADLDGDGDADIIAGYQQGGLLYLRNQVEKLVIDPPARTALVSSGFTLSSLTEQGSVSWQVNQKLSRCGSAGLRACPSIDNAGHYVAGSVRGVVDVLEAVDDRGGGNKVLGRSYVNVIGPSDQTASGKAIIIAGTKAQDDIAGATNAIANRAYLTLLFRGFPKDNIRYLSFNPNQDVDGNGRYDDIAGVSTFQSALTAFRDFAPGASQLTVVMVNHGQVVTGTTEFLLTATGERIQPTDLASWLDTLQNTGAHPPVSLMMDFCYSGDFARKLPFNPAVAKRVVAASTTPIQRATLSLNGEVSFGGAFLSAAFQGFDLQTATDLAGATMSSFAQTAQLNDDGDTTPNSGDGSRAAATRVGPSHVVGQDVPVLERISPAAVLGGGNSRATLWVDHVTSVYPIDRAWCTVIPTDATPPAPDDPPIVTLTEIDLSYSRTNQRYEAEATFNANGVFGVQCRVRDVWGSVSFPKTTQVTQGSYDQRLIIAVGGPNDSSIRFEAANNLGNAAYRTAIARGFDKTHIQYLNPRTGQDVDGDGSNESIVNATSASLTTAINQVSGANELTLVLIGPNGSNAFQLATGDTISGATLNGLLNTFQSSNQTVNVIAEFAGAASLIPQLAPAGCPAACPTDTTQHKDRAVITTAQPGVNNLLASNGVLSGLQLLLSQYLKGDSLGRSLGITNSTLLFMTGNTQGIRFDLSRPDLVGTTGYTPGTANNPSLVIGDAERPALGNRFFGPGFKAGVSIPQIGRQLAHTTLAPGTPLYLWADNITSSNSVKLADGTVEPARIVRVWAVIAKPAGTLDEIDLAFNATRARWEASYATTSTGTYKVALYARDQFGNQIGRGIGRALVDEPAKQRVSVPGTTQLDVGAGGVSVSFATDASTLNEGSAQNLVVALSQTRPTDVHIPLILGGSAANAVDYGVAANGIASPASITIPANQPSATIYVEAFPNADSTVDESIVLGLGNPDDANVALGRFNTHSATIPAAFDPNLLFRNGFE